MKKGFLLLVTLLIIVLFSTGIIAQSEIPELVSDVGKYFYSYTTVISVALNERINSFFEIYGTMKEGFIPSNNFDCGIAYLHAKNIQIDISVGTTLNNDISDWFGGLGISVRLPR
jgi:hypothetical protein